jgi:hypothetical protein
MEMAACRSPQVIFFVMTAGDSSPWFSPVPVQLLR